METSPFYNHDHPFFVDEYLSLPNTTIEIAAIGFSNEFHQPFDQILPTSSCEGNDHDQASIGINNSQSSDSLMPMVGLTTNFSSNDAQPNDKPKDTCKRGKKQKKSNVDQENKKMKDIKEGHTGYIHVRARRDEATDSHSLAERVRREKIREKMKTLQAIVPGCDQITGKALMLDQVINYVQTLQNEVQILSLELASVNNPMLHGYETDFEKFIPNPHQSNEEALWDFVDQRQELVDPFANINFNSF